MIANLRSKKFTKDYSIGLLLSENKMMELIQERYITKGLKDARPFDAPYAKYEYEVLVDQADVLDGDTMNQIRLKVFWSSGKSEKSILLHSFLFDEEAKIPIE